MALATENDLQLTGHGQNFCQTSFLGNGRPLATGLIIHFIHFLRLSVAVDFRHQNIETRASFQQERMRKDSFSVAQTLAKSTGLQSYPPKLS